MSGIADLVYDVKAYGAVGNGITDDAAAVNAAVTAAAGGGIIWFPPGTYLVGSTITVNTSGIYFAGAGVHASIIKAAPGIAASDVLVFGDGITTLSYGGVADLTVTSASVKSGGYGINLNKVYEFRLENIRADNMYDSVRVYATMARITDSTFGTQGRHGIVIEEVSNGEANDYYISNCLIANNSVVAGGCGILARGGEAIWAVDCDIIKFDYGIKITPASGNFSRWHFFTGCAFDTCGTNPIYVGGQSSGDATGITFTNCWAASSTGASGVYVGGNSGGLVSGITFDGCRVLNNAHHGFELATSARDITIADCVIASNGSASAGTYSGVRVAAGITHLTVTGTRAWNGLGQGTVQQYGIDFVSGATDYVVAQGNDLSGNLSSGINNQAGVSGTHLAIGNNL